jgi:hypothetical protein
MRCCFGSIPDDVPLPMETYSNVERDIVICMFIYIYIYMCVCVCGPGSSVGIVTGYELYGPGI